MEKESNKTTVRGVDNTLVEMKVWIKDIKIGNKFEDDLIPILYKII
jgi:hypothetical protein